MELTDAQKKLIREEETFRARVRAELASPTVPDESILWKRLNSPIVLWLLGTVSIGLVTWLYGVVSTWRLNVTADRSRADAAVYEVDHRLGLAAMLLHPDNQYVRVHLSAVEKATKARQILDGTESSVTPDSLRGVPVSTLLGQAIPGVSDDCGVALRKVRTSYPGFSLKLTVAIVALKKDNTDPAAIRDVFESATDMAYLDAEVAKPCILVKSR